MDRIRKSLILLAVIAVPAAAHSTFAPQDELCFASGAATYKLAPKASWPDYRVKIDNSAPRPDLRMQLVDRPEIADFVLADDYGAVPGNACRSAAPLKTIKIDSEAQAPDVTVSFGPGDTMPDYRVYVHSVRYSQQDVAALLAVLWKAQQAAQARRAAANATVNLDGCSPFGVKRNCKLSRTKIAPETLKKQAARGARKPRGTEPVGKGPGVPCRFVRTAGNRARAIIFGAG